MNIKIIIRKRLQHKTINKRKYISINNQIYNYKIINNKKNKKN